MKRLFIFFIATISASVIVAGFAGCAAQKNTADPLIRTAELMGTSCSISLYDKKDEAVMQKAFDYIREIGDKVTVNQPGSEVDAINNGAGVAPVAVSADVFDMIQKGLAYCGNSDGVFDISVGPLTSMWRIGFSDARVPSQAEIDAAVPLVDYKEVQLDAAAQTVYLPRVGMKLDLGGIAKGYIADKAAQILRDGGVHSAIVNLGGSSIVMVGSKAGKPWLAGVQDPKDEQGVNLGVLNLTDMSIGTSGIYERTFTQGGKTYHHMLDPATGYPFDNDIEGVTIICKNAIDGDGYSTTLCGLGLEKGLAKAESVGIEAVFVTKDNEVYITSGLEGNFRITNDSYKLMN